MIMKLDETLLLQWSDFQKNLSSSVESCYSKTDFCDVTLACEDDADTVAAHRIVLSSGSSFFQRVLRKTSSHPQPLVFLPGLRKQHLDSILAFLYFGWARVPQEDLLDFLSAARLLGVRGLESEGEKDKIKSSNTKGSDKEEEEGPGWQIQAESSNSEESLQDLEDDKQLVSTLHHTGILKTEEGLSKSAQALLKRKYTRNSNAPVWQFMTRSVQIIIIVHHSGPVLYRIQLYNQ